MKLLNLTPKQILDHIEKRTEGSAYKSLAIENNTTPYFIKLTINTFSNMDEQQIIDKTKDINSILHARWYGKRDHASEYQMYKESRAIKKRDREALSI